MNREAKLEDALRRLLPFAEYLATEDPDEDWYIEPEEAAYAVATARAALLK